MRPLKLGLSTTLLIQAYFANIAGAQAVTANDADAEALQQQVSGGDITRPAAGAASGIQLNASTNSNQASLNLGTANPNGTNWSMLFSSPLTMGGSSNGGSSATNTSVATLNGLANGFAATFKLSRFRFARVEAGNDTTNAMVTKALTTCLATATSDAGKKTCNDMAPGVLINRYDPADMQAYLKEHFSSVNNVLAYTYGLQAAVGYNSFTYYQPTNLMKSSQEDIPHSIGTYLGFVPSLFTAPTFIDLAANYQQAYMAMPSTTKCKTVNVTINCQTGSIGAPNRMDKVLLSLDGNTEFRPFNHLIGIGPQITYDPKNNQEGVDFPIYFIPDTKGNLIGGITAGWTNTQHFTIGLIVGAPFSFFTQSK
jgi:hypothetical protein